MRARKLLKISAITIGCLALLLLFLVAFFLFNPFEGSLTEMRDVVPRGVDFYAHKSKLSRDFTYNDGSSASEDFPYVPALEEVGSSQAWKELRKREWWKSQGITKTLATVRKEFQRVRKDLSFIHPIGDLIGNEVQIAGYFGDRGIEDSRWCAYTRVSWRGKAAHGGMAQSFVRSQMESQGIMLSDDPGGFFRLQMKKQGLDLYLARHLDCVMISNDKPLLQDSMKLAKGERSDVEPLGTSGHFKDGVEGPQNEWLKRTQISRSDFNAMEWHLQPGVLISKDPSWRNWPDPNNEDKRNERILASFLNVPSFRFLSGSVIFEPRSISFLSNLVVNSHVLTDFQKPIFSTEATPRKLWMNAFFDMVPREACGAAALKIPAAAFMKEMYRDAMDKVTREEIDRSIRSTRSYQSFEDLVDKIGLSLRPRVGVVFRPNRRSPETKKSFPVNSESPFPQCALVFWVRKGSSSGRVLNKPLSALIEHINTNRQAFGINAAYRLGLSGKGVQSDVAFEFAVPFFPGTGSVAAATVGEYFILSNSGPFIRSMVRALRDGTTGRSSEADFKEFESEMPASINGVAFAWADQLRKVSDDFLAFSKSAGGTMDPSFGLSNRPKAASVVFRRPNWVRYGSKARIPQAEKPAFETEVTKELRRMWGLERARREIGSEKALQQFSLFTRTFRSAYLQMVLNENSLKVWGRALAPDYKR